MVRAPCCEKMGLKKGPWTPEEDHILISYIDKYGHGNWRALPKLAGLLRCGKSCRLRWINYLRPDIKRGNFTREEEETIINLHEMLGNRWSAIAARLPGRTDNEIKNVWHTHLKKRLNNKNSHGSSETKQANSSATYKMVSKKSLAEPQISNNNNNSNTSTMSSSSSPQESSSSEFSSVTEANSASTIEADNSNNNKHMVVSMNNTNIKDESMEFSQDFPEIDESFWSEALSGDPFELSEGLLQHQSSSTSSESVGLDFGLSGTNVDDSMDFWYDLFISAGGSPELPEF